MDQLKDVILSTLAEIQETVPPIENESKKEYESSQEGMEESKKIEDSKRTKVIEKSFFEKVTAHSKKTPEFEGGEDELLFLESLRERFLVLFEGFQAPNNTALEAKIDLTLNFLEFVLSAIDERIENIKGK